MKCIILAKWRKPVESVKRHSRYYDKLGILSPDEICHENGYRYYSKKNMLSIPVIKYYKQSGFKLEEIKNLIYKSECKEIEESFREKIEDARGVRKKISIKEKIN